MTWTTPLTAVSSTALTAAQWNASVRDNLLETGPAKATAAGRFFATTGANSIAERVPTESTVSAAGVVSSTSYVLVTGGPTLTVTTGPVALVFIACVLSNDTTGSNSYATYQIGGATSIAASDSWLLGQSVSGANRTLGCSRVKLHTGLTPGSNSFTMYYRVSGGNGTFQDRQLGVVPF